MGGLCGVGELVWVGASPVTLILQSWSPASTFSPSGTNSSSITPETGEGTGIANWMGITLGGR